MASRGSRGREQRATHSGRRAAPSDLTPAEARALSRSAPLTPAEFRALGRIADQRVDGLRVVLQGNSSPPTATE